MPSRQKHAPTTNCNTTDIHHKTVQISRFFLEGGGAKFSLQTGVPVARQSPVHSLRSSALSLFVNELALAHKTCDLRMGFFLDRVVVKCYIDNINKTLRSCNGTQLVQMRRMSVRINDETSRLVLWSLFVRLYNLTFYGKST